MLPDCVCDFGILPFRGGSVDILVYDPPHLPDDVGLKGRMAPWRTTFGIGRSVKGENIGPLFPGFLAEAKRVLRKNGIVLAKIKDYIHNNKYQANSHIFCEEARNVGLTIFDILILVHPSGGSMISGRWKNAIHSKNKHVYWIVLKKEK